MESLQLGKANATQKMGSKPGSEAGSCGQQAASASENSDTCTGVTSDAKKASTQKQQPTCSCPVQCPIFLSVLHPPVVTKIKVFEISAQH